MYIYLLSHAKKLGDRGAFSFLYNHGFIYAGGGPTVTEILHLCNLRGENYIYLQDLLALESNSQSAHSYLPVRATAIVTPLLLPAWCRFLDGFPDCQFSAFILRGIADGFRVGLWNHPRVGPIAGICNRPTSTSR